MELRQLRYFVALADRLNFTRAAEDLAIATPSLSQQIKALEDGLGAQLFKRNKRHVQLTDAGRVFLDEARLTLEQAHRAEQAAQRAARGEIGRVKIGYVSSAALSGLLSEIVSRYRKAYPHVDIQLSKVQGQLLVDAVLDGSLDMALLSPRLPYPQGLTGTFLLRGEVMLATYEDHRLSQMDLVRPSQLRHENFIMPFFSETEDVYPILAAVAREGSFKPDVVQKGQDFFTVIALVAAGLGVAVVPESCRCLQLPGVRYIKIAMNDPPATLAAVYRRGEQSSILNSLVKQLVAVPSS